MKARLLLASLVLALAAPLCAQPSLERALIFTGTTLTATNGDTYAYLVWSVADASVLANRTLALYRKSGTADSTNTFSRLTILKPAEDSQLVASLKPRAVKLGDDLSTLDAQLDRLIGDLAPVDGALMADKLAVLVTASRNSPEQRQALHLLARQHPLVGFAMGLAYADQITPNGFKTYELRDYDAATDSDRAVVGRITVNPQNVLVLPAPGVLAEVPDTTAKGNRNVSLRWSTPNALRDLTPLHYGFDLYRLPRAKAVDHGWLNTPPSTVAELLTEPAVTKLNPLPILPPVMLTNEQAEDAGDIWTAFVNDDNGRFQPNGEPFNDGQRVVYFTCARDIVGRPGLLSPPCDVTVFDRYPPKPPTQLRVTNYVHYFPALKTRAQRLKLQWDAAKSEDSGGIAAYYIYRWRTPSEIPPKSQQRDPTTGQPNANLIAIVPGTQLSYIDDHQLHPPPAWADPPDSTSPTPANDLGKTYYYTVRALDDSQAGNLSGNSAPAWGVLRDNDGPGAPTVSLLIQSFKAKLNFDSFTQVPAPGLATFPAHLRLLTTSNVAKGLEWAEFKLESANGDELYLGRTSFKIEAGLQVARLDRDVVQYHGLQKLHCRVGTLAGVVTDWIPTSKPSFNSPAPQSDARLQVRWHVPELESAAQPAGPSGTRHLSVDPLTDKLTDITGGVIPSDGAKEFKIYRRVGFGPQTLIVTGVFTDANAITWTDPNPPGAGVTVCYFCQVFDEHGNPSVMTPIATCIEVGDPSFLKAPILDQPLATGTAADPKMKLRWFCGRPGVDRFEIWIGLKSGNRYTPPTSTRPKTSQDLAQHPNVVTTVPGAEGTDFVVLQTGPAQNIGVDGDPSFEVELPVNLTETHLVMVRAVGPGSFGTRHSGAFSNLESFVWNLVPALLSDPIPWPARALPPKESFHPAIVAGFIDHSSLAPWRGVGIRIGEYVDPAHGPTDTVIPGPANNPNDPKVSMILGTHRVESHLYTQDLVAAKEPNSIFPGMVLPVAMYRTQLPSMKFPDVPGDLYQVSPLIEEIAQDGLHLTLAGGEFDYVRVTDPFVCCMHHEQTTMPRSSIGYDHGVFLLDRQPVIKGAKYRYYLVRFTPLREIDRVIVTNDVEIPE